MHPRLVPSDFMIGTKHDSHAHTGEKMPGLAGLMRGRVGMAWMPARQAVENVNSGVTIGGEDNSSPLFVRPPWQARLLIPI